MEIFYESSLAHHGIKGQKWGVRRFQREDGTWTAKGKDRREDQEDSGVSSKTKSGSSSEKKPKSNVAKKVAITAGVVAGTAVAALAAKKLHDAIKDENVKLKVAEAKKYVEESPTFNQKISVVATNTFADGKVTVHDFSKEYEKLFPLPDKKEYVDTVRDLAKQDTFSDAFRNVASSHRVRLPHR